MIGYRANNWLSRLSTGWVRFTNSKYEPLLRRVDIALFGFLLLLILAYQLQLLLAPIYDLRVRELLYLYLYLRVLVFYRMRLTPGLLAVVAFLILCAFAAMHTYLVYGAGMAVPSFLRFVGVALLAPLAAAIFTNFRQVEVFVTMWLAVVALGAATAVYQLLGGDLSWLVQDYLALRGSLMRFKTLLGEPNVGGMASIIIYVFAVLSFRSWIWKSFLLVAALILLVLSVSKAGIAGFIIATTLMIALHYRSGIRISTAKKVAAFAVGSLILGALVMGFSGELRQNFGDYAMSGLRAFLGSDLDNKNLVTDLSNRLTGRALEGTKIAYAQSSFYPLNVLAGSSFGVAGSVASELRGDAAILPHNSLLEIYLVGGILLLAVFLIVLFTSFQRLWAERRANGFRMALLIGFLVMVAFAAGYPIIYEPVLGSFFWLVVGVAANAWLANGGREVRK